MSAAEREWAIRNRFARPDLKAEWDALTGAIVRHKPALLNVDGIPDANPDWQAPSAHQFGTSVMRARRKMGPQRTTDDRPDKRLTGRELEALFDGQFPYGFAGANVLAEIAPEGWEHSPLLASFHPSVPQLFEERVATPRNLEGWRRLQRRRERAATLAPRPEPTFDEGAANTNRRQ